MASPGVAGVGGVLSADIAVPEHERELRFYSRVLTTGERPLWREDLMNSGGVPIIGLGERKPAHADLPLQWMPHIQVADVAASAERALSRGGNALMRHEDDQWAVLSDPNGATFGIVPEVASESIPPMEGGRISWLDLTVADAAHTRDFYQEVVGWSAEDVQMEDAAGPYADYALCMPDGTAVAGVCHARGVNRDLPPVWLIYLPVGDLGESLARARDEGGGVVAERKDSAGAHAYAVVRDPVGACFALVPG
ncbi:MAG: VOC family protein [Longimicrobiales bacterium]|nr:VOC family protein [Longimicrobiales bacterium]